MKEPVREPDDVQALATVFASALISPVRLSPGERLKFAAIAVADFRKLIAAPLTVESGP